MNYSLENFMQLLKNNNITALAFDFDATALQYGTTLTSGYKNTSQFHKDYVRKMSKDFIRVVNSSFEQGIHVGIATFNDDMLDSLTSTNKLILGGHGLIRPILRALFDEDIVRQIEIWAFNPEIHGMVAFDGQYVNQDKNWHLQNIRKRYKIKNNNQVLLIDDDWENIKAARKSGFRAWYVSGNHGFNIKEFDKETF
jgi:acid phosphatase class B